MRDLTEIAEQGEESGREECADDFPFLPRIGPLTQEQYRQQRRVLTWRGRERAQGLYGLRGRRGRVFAQNWAMGYHANCDLFEREGHFEEEEAQTLLLNVLTERISRQQKEMKDYGRQAFE